MLGVLTIAAMGNCLAGAKSTHVHRATVMFILESMCMNTKVVCTVCASLMFHIVV